MALVGVDELADFFDVHKNTIYQWVKEKCPIVERADARTGRSHKFDTSQVIKWRTEKAVYAASGNTDLLSTDEAKRRKLAAEAGIQEIALAREKGTVIDLSQFEKELSNTFAELRASMRKIPERVVLRIVGETDESVIKKTLLAEIDQALVDFHDEYH